MKRSIWSLLACGALMACGTSSTATSSPSTPTSPSPTATPVACVTSGPASSNWPSAQPVTATITSVEVVGDTLTFTFTQGTPAFDVAPQSTAQFSADPSGRPIQLAGSAGVHIALRGFRGDVQTYAGVTTITASGQVLRQVYELGDFEGVITWGAGVSAPSCAAVTATGSTLSFQFIRQPAA